MFGTSLGNKFEYETFQNDEPSELGSPSLVEKRPSAFTKSRLIGLAMLVIALSGAFVAVRSSHTRDVSVASKDETSLSDFTKSQDVISAVDPTVVQATLVTKPTTRPSKKPSTSPTTTKKPTSKPSKKPTTKPSKKPSTKPSTNLPSLKPSAKPSSKPSLKPIVPPTTSPIRPTNVPSLAPIVMIPKPVSCSDFSICDACDSECVCEQGNVDCRPYQWGTIIPVVQNPLCIGICSDGVPDNLPPTSAPAVAVAQVTSCSDFSVCDACDSTCKCEQGNVDCRSYQWGTIIPVVQNPLCIGICSDGVPDNLPPTSAPVVAVAQVPSCSDFSVCDACDSTCKCEQGNVDCRSYQWGTIIPVVQNPLCIGMCSDGVPEDIIPTTPPTHHVSCENPDVCNACDTPCYCEYNGIECDVSMLGQDVLPRTLGLCAGFC